MSKLSPKVRSDEEVFVLFVEKKDAKRTKTKLEGLGLLNKDYRLTPCTTTTRITTTVEQGSSCIAVPLINENVINEVTAILSTDDINIQGFGKQICPYNTSLLGNSNQVRPLPNQSTTTESSAIQTLVQLGLLQAFTKFFDSSDDNNVQKHLAELQNKLLSLDNNTCPKTLQYLGDDKTLVIPLRALDIQRDESFKEFISFRTSLVASDGNDDDDDDKEQFINEFLWPSLASVFGSPRIVRRGEISPESKIRLSEYKILWPMLLPNDNSQSNNNTFGPGSPGWITVTEQGIKQSFDLTKVMFSRGNITEKIRFGHLVQLGERVFDMYAGIGYFTLPALVHGGAEFVICCEWNEQAVKALKYNLKDNGVMHRAQVLVGDCRELAKEHNLIDMFDRVSLGLLPSSEGGWRTAVRSVRRSTGGWLHIHGNVPFIEVDEWATWLSSRLRYFVQEDIDVGATKEWVVVVTHIEKVKSFAPTVNHYVADVFVGPYGQLKQNRQMGIEPGDAGVMDKQNGQFRKANLEGKTPSCALSETGILNQDWMRES